jgi:hypothetical protein
MLVLTALLIVAIALLAWQLGKAQGQLETIRFEYLRARALIALFKIERSNDE